MRSLVRNNRRRPREWTSGAHTAHSPEETIDVAFQVRVAGARRRSCGFEFRRTAGAGSGRPASDRDRVVSEPGLLLLPAGEREPDPVLAAPRRARAQFRGHLLGSARLEGYVRDAAIYAAAI